MAKVSEGWGFAWAWGGNPHGGRKFAHNQPYKHRKGGSQVRGGKRTYESPERGATILTLFDTGRTGPRKRVSLTSMDPRTYRLKLRPRRKRGR